MDIDPAEVAKLRQPDVGHRWRTGRRRWSLLDDDGRAGVSDSWLRQCEAWTREFAWRYDAPGRGHLRPETVA